MVQRSLDMVEFWIELTALLLLHQCSFILSATSIFKGKVGQAVPVRTASFDEHHTHIVFAFTHTPTGSYCSRHQWQIPISFTKKRTSNHRCQS